MSGTVKIRSRFGTHRFCDVAGGPSFDVVFQDTLSSGSSDYISKTWRVQFPIAVVTMIDRSLVEDAEWAAYLGGLDQSTMVKDLGANLLPVAMDPGVLDDLALQEQAIRWDEWSSANEAREQRLMRELAYSFARMLCRHLYVLRLAQAGDLQLEKYLYKIQAFLSYSKYDEHGTDIAETIRFWRCRVEALSERRPDTVFMSRPADLVSLATLEGERDTQRVVVYPDPPLYSEELCLLSTTWSGLRIRTMTQWLAEEPS